MKSRRPRGENGGPIQWPLCPPCLLGVDDGSMPACHSMKRRLRNPCPHEQMPQDELEGFRCRPIEDWKASELASSSQGSSHVSPCFDDGSICRHRQVEVCMETKCHNPPRRFIHSAMVSTIHNQEVKGQAVFPDREPLASRNHLSSTTSPIINGSPRVLVPTAARFYAGMPWTQDRRAGWRKPPTFHVRKGTSMKRILLIVASTPPQSTTRPSTPPSSRPSTSATP